jgi:peptidase E
MKWHYDAIVALAREARVTRDVRLAILPTARRNRTSPRLGPWDDISRQFAERGCEVIDILVGDVPAGQREMDRGEVEAMLARADLLFVPGGDTRYLLEILRSQDLEGIFRSAIEAGLVTAGSSAGTLWLAERGMSDSESFTAEGPWQFIMVEGLAVLPYTINVHDNAGRGGGCASPRTRREQFEDRFLAEKPERLGLAIDEFAALEVRGRRGGVRSPSSGIGIDLLRRTEAGIERRRIEEIAVVPNFAG